MEFLAISDLVCEPLDFKLTVVQVRLQVKSLELHFLFIVLLLFESLNHLLETSSTSLILSLQNSEVALHLHKLVLSQSLRGRQLIIFVTLLSKKLLLSPECPVPLNQLRFYVL